jgi:hypothetical protein
LKLKKQGIITIQNSNLAEAKIKIPIDGLRKTIYIIFKTHADVTPNL